MRLDIAYKTQRWKRTCDESRSGFSEVLPHHLIHLFKLQTLDVSCVAVILQDASATFYYSRLRNSRCPNMLQGEANNEHKFSDSLVAVTMSRYLVQ